MWPLHIVLLFAMAAQAQQNPSALTGAYIGNIPQIVNLQAGRMPRRRVSPEELRDQNTCYVIRSYHFRRQDGFAPVPAGVTTCTPANAVRQRQVAPAPRVLYVPLGIEQAGGDEPQK